MVAVLIFSALSLRMKLRIFVPQTYTEAVYYARKHIITICIAVAEAEIRVLKQVLDTYISIQLSSCLILSLPSPGCYDILTAAPESHVGLRTTLRPTCSNTVCPRRFKLHYSSKDPCFYKTKNNPHPYGTRSFHKKPPFYPVLSHLNPVKTHTAFYWGILMLYFNLRLFLGGLFSSVF
jgi:hypothetical protein